MLNLHDICIFKYLPVTFFFKYNIKNLNLIFYFKTNTFLIKRFFFLLIKICCFLIKNVSIFTIKILQNQNCAINLNVHKMDENRDGGEVKLWLHSETLSNKNVKFNRPLIPVVNLDSGGLKWLEFWRHISQYKNKLLKIRKNTIFIN